MVIILNRLKLPPAAGQLRQDRGVSTRACALAQHDKHLDMQRYSEVK